MNLHLEIPEDLARRLAPDDSALARAALEALAIEGVRSGRLTTFQARQLLGIESRFDMDGFLNAHGVFADLTAADVLKDADVALGAAR